MRTVHGFSNPGRNSVVTAAILVFVLHGVRIHGADRDLFREQTDVGKIVLPGSRCARTIFPFPKPPYSRTFASRNVRPCPWRNAAWKARWKRFPSRRVNAGSSTAHWTFSKHPTGPLTGKPCSSTARAKCTPFRRTARSPEHGIRGQMQQRPRIFTRRQMAGRDPCGAKPIPHFYPVGCGW